MHIKKLNSHIIPLALVSCALGVFSAILIYFVQIHGWVNAYPAWMQNIIMMYGEVNFISSMQEWVLLVFVINTMVIYSVIRLGLVLYRRSRKQVFPKVKSSVEFTH